MQALSCSSRTVMGLTFLGFTESLPPALLPHHHEALSPVRFVKRDASSSSAAK